MNPEYTIQFLKRISGTTEHTKSCYLSSINLYSNFIRGQDPDIESVKDFLQSLEDGQYSANSINRHLSALKNFFKANNLQWDENIKLQHVDLYNLDRPATSIENIKLLIDNVRERNQQSDMAYLALSTIYGLRREELARVTTNEAEIDKFSNDKKKPISIINKTENTILIGTLKGGLRRKHLIPDEIAFIKDYPFEMQTLNTISLLFVKLCLLAGYEKQPNEGWHGIRASLTFKAIEAGISRENCSVFMRWSPKEMVDRYASRGFNPIVADKVIFKKHPFLPFWR